MMFRLASLMLLLVTPFSTSSPGGQAFNNDAGPADPQIAAAVNGVSAQMIQAAIQKMVSFGTRLTLSAQDQKGIAAGHGIGAAREWIRAEFNRYSRDCGGCLEVKIDSFIAAPSERIPRPTQIVNVYAVLKGAKAEAGRRIVLVSGHYDSRNSDTLDISGAAPGANDDASGTAVSLECARVLSKLKLSATIIFLAVAGEEQGLNGSEHFAEMAKRQGWTIEAVLNNDIVGGDRNPQQDRSVVRVFSEGVPVAASDQEIGMLRTIGGENDSTSRELARYVGEVSRSYGTALHPLLILRPDRYLRGGDHFSFNQQGFAAVRFTEYREDFHHQHQNVRTEGGMEYGDLPKFVDFDYVAHVAQLNAATLASLAAAPAPPGNVRLLTRRLENHSTLTWAPAAGASGYEIVWRKTSSSDWDQAEKVGDVNQVTLEIPKDNVIFAVRSVDGQGHRSLPVVASPEQ